MKIPHVFGVGFPTGMQKSAGLPFCHSLTSQAHTLPPLLRDETPKTLKAMLIPTSQAILRPDIPQPGIHIQTGRQFINHNIKGSRFTTHTGDLEKRRERRSQLRDRASARDRYGINQNWHRMKHRTNAVRSKKTTKKTTMERIAVRAEMKYMVNSGQLGCVMPFISNDKIFLNSPNRERDKKRGR